MAHFPIELSVDELIRESRRIAQVELTDPEILEPLTILHRAYGEEAQLDAAGAHAMTRALLRLLVNRLRMKRDFLAHPEIEEQAIKGPIVIMGVARSGTTKLQKLLASSGDFNWLPFWMNWNWASVTGKPNESVEPRVAEADEHCRWHERRSPDTKLGHYFEALQPEEESVLTEGCFVSPTFLGHAEIPSYGKFLASQPPNGQFEFVRDCLKYLQWQGLASADKPWLLKSPNYNGLEVQITKTFPGARLVVAHRNPFETMTSMCKLVQCFRHAYSDFKPDLGMIMEFNYRSMAAHLANRRAHPELPILDVRFEDIVRSPSAALKRVYAHAGMQMPHASLERMLEWDAGNAMHRHGEFKYSLAEVGLDEATVRLRMSEYFDFIASLAEKAS